jgi:hypothetical protein
VRVLLLVLVMLVVAVPSALATTAPDKIVGVAVDLKPRTVTLSATHVPRGNYVQFRVRNTTATRRLFSVAGRTIAVPPRTFRFLVIMFGVRGTYAYASHPGARGTFKVT